MSLAKEIGYGFKGFLAKINSIDCDDYSEELTGELRISNDIIGKKGKEFETKQENGVTVHSGERIITAPNIPLIGAIVGKLKIEKANKRLREAIKEKESIEASTLKQDTTVTAAVETNSFTNPNGKNVVKTKAAIKNDKSNPREPGGKGRNTRIK